MRRTCRTLNDYEMKYNVPLNWSGRFFTRLSKKILQTKICS